MFSLVSWNRASAAKVASALDEAAACSGDSMIIRSLIRLKNLALESRARGFRVRKADRANLEKIAELKQLLRDGAEMYEVMHRINEIESGVYERERSRGAESQMVVNKRRLFGQLRALNYQIEWLEQRRTRLAREGYSLTGGDQNDPSLAVYRDEFVICTQWLKQALATHAMVRRSIRNMNTVHMLLSEERCLAQMERDSANLPSVEEVERMLDRIAVQTQESSSNAETLDALRREFEALGSGQEAEAEAADVNVN